MIAHQKPSSPVASKNLFISTQDVGPANGTVQFRLRLDSLNFVGEEVSR